MKHSLQRVLFIAFSYLVLFPQSAFTEGTKQFRPVESDKGERCIDTTRNKFASVTATADYRLYIHISDYTTETIYFGFGESKHNSGSTQFRLYRPNGTIDTSGTVPITSGNRGYIDTWSQAVAGPSVVAGPSGYWALRCTPDMNGDYYIAFKISWQGGFQDQYKTFANFDVTVVSPSLWTAKEGRLWSKAWQLYAEMPDFGSNNQYWGKMFIYSIDSIVTKVDLNGMIHLRCNKVGQCGNSPFAKYTWPALCGPGHPGPGGDRYKYHFVEWCRRGGKSRTQRGDFPVLHQLRQWLDASSPL